MEENCDKFSSSQQHTTGSKETLERSFTEETEQTFADETEQTTPTKLLMRTPLIDDQKSTNKNSPQEEVAAVTSKQYLSDSSNISPSQRMDDESKSKVTYTSCEIKETVAKPEESGNFSNTKALKTEEFNENTQSRENPIDDTKHQTSNYDLTNTDQTSSETLIKDVYENSENSAEADDSQDKLHYSETTRNLPKTIQGSLKNQGEFEILNFPSEIQQSENYSLALSEGKEILKAKCDSNVLVSPKLSYISEISLEPDDSISREPKNSESEDSQTKGVLYTPSSKSTEIVEISENLCGLKISKKSLTVAEEHYSVKNLTTESLEPETSCTSASQLGNKHGIFEENFESRQNTVQDRAENTVQNPSSTEIPSNQTELQVKSNEVSRESVSAETSSGSGTFSLNMGALITDVNNNIVVMSRTFSYQNNLWRNRSPTLERIILENIQRHGHIMARFRDIHENLTRIAHSANSSVINIFGRIRDLRLHFDVLSVVGHAVNSMEYYLTDLEDVSRVVSDLRLVCAQNPTFEYYYREFNTSVLQINRALRGIIGQLQRIETLYRNEHE